MATLVLAVLLIVVVGAFVRPVLWWLRFSRHLRRISSDTSSGESSIYYLYLRQEVYSLFHRTITHGKDVDYLLKEMARSTAEVFGCDSWSVLLTPSGKEWNYVAWSEDLDKVNLRGIARGLSETENNNIKRLIETKEVCFIQDTRSHELWTENVRSWGKFPTPVRSWLGIPLIVNDVVVGVINLDWFKPRSIKPYMVRSVERVLQDISQVLESLEEFKSVVLESDLDVLLKIPNRKSFDRFATRIESEGRRVGVVLIDIERLKRFNDVYGHSMGNELLKSITSRIAENIRKEDRLFRYGGDEFVILVENPTAETLKGIERKLRHVFLRIFDVEREGKHVFAKVNIKIGYAIYPDEADSILHAVDVAMSRARQI